MPDLTTRYKQNRHKRVLERLNEIANSLTNTFSHPPAQLHKDADEAIVQFLRDLGYFDVADAWEKISPKWYE